MLNTNIKTPSDLKEAAKRARAAQIEEERKPRIFNVKSRLIGLDVEALKKQQEEKEALKVSLKAEDEAYLALQKFEAKRLKELESKIEDEKKRYQAEILEYRKHHQQLEQSREFDLNDPYHKRKDKPCRLGDDDPRLTISSMQKFEGDEGSAGERKKIQRAQIKTWLVQQIKEKKEVEATREAAEISLLQSAAANDKRIKELDDATEKCRKEIDTAVLQFNYLMAKEKEAAKEAEKKKEYEDTLMHINNMVNSEMLSGTSGGQPSQLSLDKVTKSTYRGMSEAEVAKIKEEQLKQIESNKERKRMENQAEVDWLNLEQVQAKRYTEANEKMKHDKRKIDQQILEENMRLAEKQRAHRRYLDEHVYKSPGPEPYFYQQFNKNTR